MIYLSDPDFTLHVGDVLDVLGQLPDESVDCVVTSPPYYGLRDYGTGSWVGGDPDHEHDTVGARGGRGGSGTLDKRSAGAMPAEVPVAVCSCGARHVDSQIGLEPTFADYIGNLVAVFAEVRRVLTKRGVVWLNMGDSYASKTRGSDKGWEHSRLRNPGDTQKRQAASLYATGGERHRGKRDGFKDKDLMMVPHRLAIALQDDGWWVRSDVVWDKPNAMPESTTDRPTKSHEYVFLLSKSLRYFYDQDAVREALQQVSIERVNRGSNQPERGAHRIARPKLKLVSGNKERKHGSDVGAPGSRGDVGRSIPWEGDESVGRNLRSVWRIASKGYKGAHFATYPEELVERCIRLGCPTDVCTACGKPRQRITTIDYVNPGNRTTNGPQSIERKHLEHGSAGYEQRLEKRTSTVGWSDCGCGAPFRHGVVLDPFIGSGTTAAVARRLGRKSVGIELNVEYAAMCAKRLDTLQLLLPEAVKR